VQVHVEKIRRLVSEGIYELSKHAERERESDMITMEELEEALKNCEIYRRIPRRSSRGKFPGSRLLFRKTNPCRLYNKN